DAAKPETKTEFPFRGRSSGRTPLPQPTLFYGPRGFCFLLSVTFESVMCSLSHSSLRSLRNCRWIFVVFQSFGRADITHRRTLALPARVALQRPELKFVLRRTNTVKALRND